MPKRWRDAVPFVALALLLIPAIAPLVGPGYFVADDADLHRWRLWEFWQAWRSGQVPVRWAPDLAYGLGSPLFTYYGPLGYLIGAAAMAWGLGAAAGVKVVFGLSLAVGAVGAWSLARAWWPRDPWSPYVGLVGAAAYLYAPYMLANVYRRAAIGEVVALAIAPWFLRAVLMARECPSLGPALLLGATLAGLIGAHVLTAVAVASIGAALAVVWLLRDRQPLRRLVALGGGAALGLGLSAFYWVPATLDVDLVHPLRTRGADLPAFWANLVPVPDMVQYTLLHDYRLDLNPLPPTWPHLGLVQVLVVIVGAVAACRALGWRQWRVLVPIVGAVAALFLASPGSAPIWQDVGALQTVQYPWRFFGVAALLGAVLAPGLVVGARRPAARGLVAAAALALAGANVGLVPSAWQDSWDTRANLADYEVGTYLPGLATYHEFFPRWVDRAGPGLLQPLATKDPVPSAGDVRSADVRSDGARLTVASASGGRVALDTFFFPDWRATLDGAPVATEPSGDLGLLGVDVPSGQHELVLARGETAAARVGDLVTLASLLLGVALAVGALAAGSGPARLAWLLGGLAAVVLAAPLALAALRPAQAPTFLAAPSASAAGPVQVLGAAVEPGSSAAPGEVDVDVSFLVHQLPDSTPRLRARLLGPDGSTVAAETERDLGSALRPRAIWEAGTVYTDRFALAPSAPVGWLELSLDGAAPLRLGPLAAPTTTSAAAAASAPAARHPLEQTAADQPVAWGPDLLLEHTRAWPDGGGGQMADGPDPTRPAFDRYRTELYFRRLVDRALAYRATVRLVDGQGTAWASVDLPIDLPAGADRDWRSALIGPWPALPPDRYKLELTLKDAAGRALAISGPAGLAGQSAFGLAAFDVDPPCQCVPPGGSVLGLDLRDGIRLLGYTRAPGPASTDVTLYWQARDRIAKRYTSFVHLLGVDQTLRAQFDRSPYDDRRPTDRWQLGDVVPFFARLPMRGPGPFRLEAGLYDDPNAGHLKRVDGGDTISLGLVDAAPVPSNLSVDFDNGARLTGATLARSGGRLRVTLGWQATRPVREPYTVFVHVVGPDGKIAAQGDGPPELGARTTAEWPRGEPILDPHDVDLADARGQLRVLVGLYRPTDGARAHTAQGADYVDLGEVPAS